MGKKDEAMDKARENDSKKAPNNKPHQLRQEAHLRAHLQKTSGNESKTQCCHESGNKPPTSPTDDGSSSSASRLVASTSSPSLLLGCSDTTTHAGANVEMHVHSHNVEVNVIPNSPGSPSAVHQPDFALCPSPSADPPPDSVFLTSNPPRPSRQNSERPNSAPADQLERISGTLLRLVGDHYLCCTCGRQLRSIGDQMTFEAHVRRTLSASSLDQINHSD